ncbi:MAG TPA: VOC family protein [Acidimicrobiales bacterium]|nr:VOC family protein [Acidimicrobiales bacterium]
MVELAALEIADQPDVWAGLGFAVEDGVCRVGQVEHRLIGGPGKGIVSWSLAGDETGVPGGSRSVDGLGTRSVPRAPRAPHPPPAPEASAGPRRHANGCLVVDHLVVSTPDLERTVAALTDAGCRERRRRHTATYGREMVQSFFRLGEVVLEVVAAPQPTGDGPARFFGLAFTVVDLDATAQWLGDRLHPAKEAVQPGRRIATLDRGAGSTVAMAFMSPGPVEYE